MRPVTSQLLTATDATNSLSWSYDLLGRIANETQAITPVVIASMANTYDSVGRRLQLATTVGGSLDSTIAYTLGAGGLVTQIQQYGTNVASKSVTYSYDVGGRRTGVSRFANLTNTQLVAQTSFDFDTIGRVTTIEHGRNNTPVASYAMVWDAGNRLTSVASLADGLSSFTYDDVHQLTSAVYTNHPNLSFSYDANGNRTGSGYSTGDDNQLLTDAQSSYQYDLNGNLIRRTNTATGAVTEYSYDHRDRLTTIRFRGSSSGPVTKQVNFDYDALNRRVAQSVDNNGDNIADETEYYVNDGLRSAREGAGDMLLLRLDSSGDVASRYLYGAAIDEILAEENIHPVTQASDVLWSLGDHIGSIRDVVRYNPATNTTQVANHLFYDAFGNIVSESDVNLEHRFAFTGREWDEEIDLQYNRARYYDPKMGRWISKDPLGFDAGDMNLYRYVGNGPTDASDPSGLIAETYGHHIFSQSFVPYLKNISEAARYWLIEGKENRLSDPTYTAHNGGHVNGISDHYYRKEVYTLLEKDIRELNKLKRPLTVKDVKTLTEKIQNARSSNNLIDTYLSGIEKEIELSRAEYAKRVDALQKSGKKLTDEARKKILEEVKDVVVTTRKNINLKLAKELLWKKMSVGGKFLSYLGIGYSAYHMLEDGSVESEELARFACSFTPLQWSVMGADALGLAYDELERQVQPQTSGREWILKSKTPPASEGTQIKNFRGVDPNGLPGVTRG